MKTLTFRALGALFGGLFACATGVTAFTPTVPPEITNPSNGATASTMKPLLIKVDNGDLPNVHSVQILSNGTPIGWAVAPDFLGEWDFPAAAHLSVMQPDPQWWPDAPPFVIDYHPDAESPMMFFEGDFVTPTQFSGTFATNDVIPQTGNVTVDFTRVNDKINIVITGDAPIGVRTHNGGENWHHETIFTYEWSTPTVGVHNLTAKLTYTDSMSWEKDVYITAPVKVTVKAPPAPEIDVRYAGRSLKDNKLSTDFGKVVKDTKGNARTYTIRNVGKAKLKNLKVLVKGKHPNDFLVTQPRNLALAPNAETTFKVRFAPGKIGPRTAQLRILSNDSDEDPFRITLLGTGK